MKHNPAEFTQAFIQVALPLKYHGSPSSQWSASHGLCWYWAYVFVNIVGGELYSYQTKDGSGHCFVKLNDRFYDAENANGLHSWKQLQSYLRKASNVRLKKHKNLNGFTRSWKIDNDYEEVFKKTIIQVKNKLRNNQKKSL